MVLVIGAVLLSERVQASLGVGTSTGIDVLHYRVLEERGLFQVRRLAIKKTALAQLGHDPVVKGIPLHLRRHDAHRLYHTAHAVGECRNVADDLERFPTSTQCLGLLESRNV